MTNSSDAHAGATGWDVISSLVTVALLITGGITLWTVDVHTNALVILAAVAGWPIAALLARHSPRSARAQAAARTREQDRALDDAIRGRDRLIGDTERDVVNAALADALAAGRITMTEWHDRADDVTAARTPSDLRATLEGLL